MQNQRPRRQTESGGFSLGEVLMVLVLVLALVGGILYFYAGKSDSINGSSLLKPASVASDAVCKTNLQTVRSAIAAKRAEDSNGKAPASLKDLGLSKETITCPVGGDDYSYDPETGEVHCPHPGHEKY